MMYHIVGPQKLIVALRNSTVRRLISVTSLFSRARLTFSRELSLRICWKLDSHRNKQRFESRTLRARSTCILHPYIMSGKL